MDREVLRIAGELYRKDSRALSFKSGHIPASKVDNPIQVFHRAIKKYGISSFSYWVEDEHEDQDVLDMLERLHIIRYESHVNGWGYNVALGGNGRGKCSEETKEKLRKAQTGKKATPETRKKQSDSRRGDKHHNYNKHHSEDTRKKIAKSVALYAKKNRTKEWPGTYYSQKNINPWNKVWKCSIGYNGNAKNLGLFHDPLSASIVYQLVWNEIYGR